MGCFVWLLWITCTFFRNNGERQWNCAVEVLGHCQRNREVRAAVWLQGLMEQQSGKIRNVLLWCLCKHLSSVSTSWFLEHLPNLLRLCLTPSTANPDSALVQHLAAGTIPLLHWVQLCSSALVWRFLSHHWGFKAGILILAVWLAGFHQRALHKSFIIRTWWLLSLSHCVRAASKALMQSKDFRIPTLKPVIPKWLPQLFRCFCCHLKVSTATGAVHRLGPTKGTAVAELRVNTDRTMEKPFKNYPGWVYSPSLIS